MFNIQNSGAREVPVLEIHVIISRKISYPLPLYRSWVDRHSNRNTLNPIEVFPGPNGARAQPVLRDLTDDRPPLKYDTVADIRAWAMIPVEISVEINRRNISTPLGRRWTTSATTSIRKSVITSTTGHRELLPPFGRCDRFHDHVITTAGNRRLLVPFLVLFCTPDLMSINTNIS